MVAALVAMQHPSRGAPCHQWPAMKFDCPQTDAALFPWQSLGSMLPCLLLTAAAAAVVFLR